MERGLLCDLSPVFRDMFSLPIPLKTQPEEKAGQGSFTVEGEVDEYPIVLPETTVEEFDHFVENCLYFTCAPV